MDSEDKGNGKPKKERKPPVKSLINPVINPGRILRERKFRKEFAKHGNGTRAAVAAGYSTNRHTAHTIAYRLLRKDALRKVWDKAAEDLEPKHIIGRMVLRAQGDPTDLLNEEGKMDLLDIKERGLGWMIKKLKVRQSVGGTAPAEIVDIELHDAHKADCDLAEIKGLKRNSAVQVGLVNLDEERKINFLLGVVRKRYPQARLEGAAVTIEQVLDRVIERELEYQGADLREFRPIVLQRLADGSFGIGAENGQKDDTQGGQEANNVQ